jgi:hypothetical protein
MVQKHQVLIEDDSLSTQEAPQEKSISVVWTLVLGAFLVILTVVTFGVMCKFIVSVETLQLTIDQNMVTINSR